MAKLDNEAKQRILKSLNQNSKATPFTGVAQTAPTSISDEQGTDSIKTTPNNEDFSNGFQMAFGKTMGTVDRGMTNVYTGIASFFEGIIDWGANVVSSFTDFIGADKATEEINKFIENRWSDDVGEFLGYTANPLARLHSAIAGVDDVRDYAWELENKKANEIVTGIEQSVGQMLPSIALGQVASGLGASAKAAGNLSTIGMSLSAAGGGSEKALSEGASSLEALGYGTATGVIEYGTEQLSGWIGKGLNKITGKSIFSEGALPFMTKNMESKLSASALGNIALQFGSEGLEEVVSDLFEPLTEAIYTKKIGQLDAGELATDFIVGGVTGSIFGSISTIADRTSKNKAQKVINQANTEIKRFDRIEDQYKVGEVSQEVYNQEKQNFKKTMKDLATEFYDIQGVQEAVTDPNNVNRLMPTQDEVDYVNGYYQTNQWTQGIQNQNVNPNFTSENPNRAENIGVSNFQKVENTSRENYNNIKIKEETSYGDDFGRIQEESRRISNKERELYWRGSKKIDENLRTRLRRVFSGEINNRTGGNPDAYGVLENTGNFKVYKNIDKKLFHDIFEISKTYLKNGELVDLHDNYNNATCYLTDDGLSGFAIEDDGNLVSVFNLNSERGLLRSIIPFIKDNSTKLDCYVLENDHNLNWLYSTYFGFKTASVMDYNMAYDHDNIAENHKKPQVAFMVNTDKNVETRHFNKDQYDEAVAYRDSYLEKNSVENEKKPEIAKDKNERKVKEYTTPISLERAIKNDTDNFLKKSAYTYIDNSDTSIKHKIKIEYTPNLDVNGKKRAGRFKRIANTDVRSLNKSTFQDISDYVYDHARIVVDNQAYTLEQLFETEKDFLVAFSNAQSKVNKLTSVSEFYQKQLAKVVSQLNTFREMVKFQESIRKSTQKMIQNMRKANKGLHTANLYLSDKVAAFEKLMEKIGDAKVYGRKTREYLRQLNDLYVKQESLQTSETDIVQEDLTPFGAHFIEPLKARIEELANGEGVLTGSELVELKKILQAFNYQLNKVANDRYVKMDGEQTGSISKDVDLYETTLSKTPARSNNSLLSAVRSKYFDNIIDPKSYFEAVDHYGLYGKGFFTQMIQDLRKRHNVELKNKLEFDQLHADFEKAHKNYFNDLRRERIEMNFQNTNGNPVNLTKGQLIGLYCTLKVESGFEHIRKSGFHYEQKSGIWAKISHTEFNADTLMSDIESHFSEVDKAYIDLVEQIMQKAKKLKSKTDMDLYGISNVEEGWYYPTKVANANFSVKVGDATATFRDIRNVANQSWNKSKNRKIFGSLMVSSVQDVLSNYERGVSRYNAYATEIDYINRVLNSVIVDETGKHRSIRYTLDKKGYQHNFMSYLNHFLSDVQGMPNPKEYSIVNQGLSHVRSATVTYTLGLNLSTMVRQTASLANAYSSPFLSVGDLTKATLSTAGINNREFNKLIKERSPFLYARFSDEEVAKANAVNEKINKAISLTMKGLTKFDKIAIAKIYRASQYSVQRRTGHAIGTETNTKMALELCEEVTRNTQPNYSSLERSAWQRPNTNELTKMLMMYMSQPMKNLSRTFEAVNENRAVRQALKNDLGNAELKTRLKQSNKQVAKTLSALTASGMIYTLMGMLMKSLMGKKDWDEWSIQEFVTGTFENTYIGMFPLIKDIYGKFVHDYDITMNSFDVINDLISSFAGVTSGISDAIQGKDVDWWNRSRKFLFSVAQVVGVPLKNMYDITYAVMKTFNPDTAYKAESLLYGTSSSTMTSDYQKYIQKGKTDQATAILKSQFEIYKTGVSPNQTVLEELNRLVSEGYTNVVPSNVGDTIVIDGETYELNANQKTKFKKYYSESTNAVNRLVVSDIYSRLTSEQQAKAIRRVYTAYYDYAKTKLMEGYLPSSKLGAVVSLNLNSTKIAEFSAIVSYASEIKATRRKTRKEQVQEFIDKQNLTKNEKYLAYVLCGYSLNETQKRSLKNFLRQNGMPTKEISDFFNEDSSEEE